MLAFGVKTCYDGFTNQAKKPKVLNQLLLLSLCNAGLLIVDHIHFQYNGFLFGFALHSIGCMLQNKPLQSALFFAILLNLKHIYLYTAPVYFIYLLKHFCLAKDISYSKGFVRLMTLGTTVIAIFGLSFGPFLYFGQISNVLQRLFPFKRGLSHAYWAPNFWALYNFADKVLLQFVKSGDKSASMTRGLVEEFEHAVLPSILPMHTFILALISMLPILVKVWFGKADPVQFLRAVILCNFGSFLFGW